MASLFLVLSFAHCILLYCIGLYYMILCCVEYVVLHWKYLRLSRCTCCYITLYYTALYYLLCCLYNLKLLCICMHIAYCTYVYTFSTFYTLEWVLDLLPERDLYSDICMCFNICIVCVFQFLYCLYAGCLDFVY